MLGILDPIRAGRWWGPRAVRVGYYVFFELGIYVRCICIVF